MSILTANLKHLYQRRGMWLVYPLLGMVAFIYIMDPKAVEGYKTNLMDKLDIHNRVDLIKYALRKGIITV